MDTLKQNHTLTYEVNERMHPAYCKGSILLLIHLTLADYQTYLIGVHPRCRRLPDLDKRVNKTNILKNVRFRMNQKTLSVSNSTIHKLQHNCRRASLDDRRLCLFHVGERNSMT